MKYKRMPIEIESPEEYGYDKIKYNLSESSISDQSLGSLGLQVPDLKLLYNEHQGSTALRKLVVQGSDELKYKDVLITCGAAGALFIIASSQLSINDHLVVMRPNYATNLETPRAIGCGISFIDLSFESGFQLDLETLKNTIKPNTKLVSITTPHNPTGTGMSLETLNDVVALTKERGILLLVDETYADISYSERLPIAASLGNHVISVSSLSKSYGIPGIRLGWLINKNTSLQETFLAAKEQINISGSVIDEWIAEQVLSRKHEILATTIREMKHRREIVASWIERDELLEWVRPEGGIVCFPRIKDGFEPAGGLAAFYHRLLHKYGTYVGPGHWYELPDVFFRIGYGWPTVAELEGGLRAISEALRDTSS
jgi:aspartate/methionine/tyrosine aminotransferase